jgi:flagellar biosynthesis protein FliQ
MENSALGNLGRRVLAWVILLAVVVFTFKLLIGVVAGLFAAMVSILLFVVLALGVIWALRHV